MILLLVLLLLMLCYNWTEWDNSQLQVRAQHLQTAANAKNSWDVESSICRSPKTITKLWEGVFDMGLRGRKKNGLCWRERLLCTECNYKSNTFNLFEGEKSGNPGRRPAWINQGLQVGLSQTSIGPSSFSTLLCSISTPPRLQVACKSVPIKQCPI